MKTNQAKYIILIAKFQFDQSHICKTAIEEKNKEIFCKRRLKFNYDLNLGCIYKNTHINKPTGMLLDSLDIKGSCIYNIYISNNHANIWLNTNNANVDDLDNCIKYISQQIKNKHNIDLVLEIEKI